MLWLPSIPYPPARDGYWSPATSTLNWCEEDYYATIYSAEIVNTLTNLMFLYLAFKGIRSCILNSHPTVFLICLLGYMTVGVGSILFHSTLKYPMQLLDELSMIYTVCIIFYANASHDRSTNSAVVLAAALVSLAGLITACHVQDPSFHSFIFGILVIAVLLLSISVMKAYIRTIHHNASATKSTGSKISDRDWRTLHAMWYMVIVGLSLFLGGFALLGIDKGYCTTLRRWRKEVGLPWGILLEGHGWWHLMTSVGAYYCIVWNIWLRHCLDGRADDTVVVWQFHLPDVVLRTSKASLGKAPAKCNGL